MPYSFRRAIAALISCFALCFFVSRPVFAQEPSTARPKIGVAFEGGGALGFAHVGVLKWFEEHRIPIDYISGTSMGGLVGGLYATGMRPAQLQELMSKIDWNETLSGPIPFRDASYRRKEDRRDFQNNLDFGLRGGFNLPSGLAPGQNITFLLDREALPYSKLKSFDDLPIPFRCVATDLVSGQKVVFTDGPLGEALRATMSVPAVFSPVRSGDRLYADGMLMDNMPVDVVKKMGADIVIAVYLNPSAFDAKASVSLFSVLNRGMGVMVSANEVSNLAAADLVVSVDLAGFTSADFTEGEKIMPKGYDAAAKKSAMLDRLSLNEADWQKYIAAREARRIRSVPVPDVVQVTGVSGALAPDINKVFANNAGKEISTDRLVQDANVIMGMGRFNGFSYHLAEQDGRNALVVRATEKDYAPPLLNFGFLIDGSDLDNVSFTADLRITALDKGGFGSEWRTDVSVGANWGLSSEYYKPIGKSKWFVAPRASATSNPFNLYDHNDQTAEYRIRQLSGGLDVGYAIDRFSQIRAGYEGGYLQAALRIGSPLLQHPEGAFGITSIKYDLDRLDSPVIPRSGESLRVRAQFDNAAPGAGGGFALAEATGSVVRKVSKRGSVFVSGAGGTTFGYQDTGLPQFFLGGTGRLNAYGTNELRMDQYIYGRLGYIHELFRLPPFLGNYVYATAAYEVAKAYDAPGASGLPTDGSVGVVLDTILGPLSIGASYGDTGHHKVYFLLGRFF
jgi:NTE family protein